MTPFNDPLARVRVAAPCSADWNEMRGDERVRFCAQCNLNVYNLSNMSRREAEAVVMRAEGRLCVRYYRRRDGTILTDNCPTGLRALKRRLSRATQAVLSTALSFCAGLAAVVGYNGVRTIAGQVEADLIDPVPIEVEQQLMPPAADIVPVHETRLVMGAYAYMPPAAVIRPVRDTGWVKGENSTYLPPQTMSPHADDAR